MGQVHVLRGERRRAADRRGSRRRGGACRGDDGVARRLRADDPRSDRCGCARGQWVAARGFAFRGGARRVAGTAGDLRVSRDRLHGGRFMLRVGKWKYCHYVAYRPQLFDLESDPEELGDLAGDARFADILAAGGRAAARNARSGCRRCQGEGAPAAIARELRRPRGRARPGRPWLHAGSGDACRNELTESTLGSRPYAHASRRGLTISNGHRYLSVHGHRGQHSVVGAGSRRDARCACAPRQVVASRDRVIRRMHCQEHGRRCVCSLRRCNRCARSVPRRTTRACKR